MLENLRKTLGKQEIVGNTRKTQGKFGHLRDNQENLVKTWDWKSWGKPGKLGKLD